MEKIYFTLTYLAILCLSLLFNFGAHRKGRKPRKPSELHAADRYMYSKKD